MPMANISARFIENIGATKQAIVECDFDASYATGGEAIDFTAAPFTGANAFTEVFSCAVVEQYSTAAPPAVLAPTLFTRGQYLPSAQGATHVAASGTVVAFAESGTGEETQVAATTNLSTVRVRLHVIGR